MRRKIKRDRLYCALFWIQGKTSTFSFNVVIVLYCALFWIQGKTAVKVEEQVKNCTVPYFGFKAKHITMCGYPPAQLYCALFWIQGKTS